VFINYAFLIDTLDFYTFKFMFMSTFLPFIVQLWAICNDNQEYLKISNNKQKILDLKLVIVYMKALKILMMLITNWYEFYNVNY